MSESIELPENYEEPEDIDLKSRLDAETRKILSEKNNTEKLYYGPRKDDEPSFGIDALRVYSDLEYGAISSANFLKDLLTGNVTEDNSLTQDERDERNMRIQRALTNAQKTGLQGGVLPTLMGLLKDKYKDQVFEPSGAPKPTETFGGMGLQMGTYMLGGIGAYKALPDIAEEAAGFIPKAKKYSKILGKTFAADQIVDQVLISPNKENLAAIIEPLLSEETKEESLGEMLTYLASSPEDTEATQRFKKSIIGLGLTATITPIFMAAPTVAKGTFNITVDSVKSISSYGNKALQNLRKNDSSFKKPLTQLSENKKADILVETFRLAREQTAKRRIDAERASNIKGEGVGVFSGKPRPTRLDFEDGAAGDTKFKTALTKWKTQDTPKDPNLPTENEILTETLEGATQIQRQNTSVLYRLRQKYFTSSGYYSPKAYTLVEDSASSQKAAIQEVTKLASRINNSLDEIGEATALAATKSGSKTKVLDNVSGVPTREGMMSRVTAAFEFNATKDLYELPRSERIEFYRTSFGLTEDLANSVYKARELVDEFTRRLYNNPKIDTATKTTLASNIGGYIKTSYRAWEDPGYRPDPQLKIEAVEATYQDLLKTIPVKLQIDKLKSSDNTGEALEKYLLAIKKQATQTIENKLEFVQDRQVIDFINQIKGAPGLHRKGDLNEATKKLLGEIKDPLENMILTVSKQSRVYEQNNFYDRIARLGRSGGWIGDKDKAAGRTVRIEGTNNFSLDGFSDDTAAIAAGLKNAASSWTYTTPEISRALTNTQGIPSFFDADSAGGQVIRFMAGAKGATQASKTVYNHTVHIRNAQGGMHFTLSNGINPFVRDGHEPFKILKNDIIEGGDEVLDEAYAKFLNLGIVDTSVRVNEFRELLSIGFERNPSDWINKNILSPESKVRSLIDPIVPSQKKINMAPNIYRVTDDYAKMNGWAYELKILKEAYPNTSLDILEQEAAEIVKNTFPHYGRVPPGVKELRYLPVGNFTGFASESIRTTGHIVMRGVKELKSDNSVIRSRGRQRLAGFITAGAIGYSGASAGSQYLMGWDMEETKAYNILAEGKYSKDANRIWSYDTEGNPQFVDTKSLDTFSVIRDPFVVLANRALITEFEGEQLGGLDGEIADAILRATLNAVSPYAGQSILTEVLTNVGFAMADEEGRDLDGKQLYAAKMNTAEKAINSVDALFAAIEPGAMPNIKKLDEALRGIENPDSGEPRDLSTELYANFLGFRKQKFDPERSLEIAVLRYQRESSANATYNLNLESTPEEAKEDYLKTQRVERNLQQDLYVITKAYSTLYDKDSEYPFENTYIQLKNSGLSKNKIMSILYGDFYPSDPNEAVQEYEDRQDINKTFPDIRKYIEGLNKIYFGLSQEKLYKYEEEAFDFDMIDKRNKELLERLTKNKGGEVLDVPNVPTEPDQRIDKMTGLPYDQQAGTAFVDEEDPIRRLGFGDGGYIDPLQRLGFSGGTLAQGLKMFFTPLKTVGKQGSKRLVQDPKKPTVMTQSEELSETLDIRTNRAMESNTASSIMPAPGKFFNPATSSYKESLTKKAEDAGIEIDLDFGKYLKMGRELGDVSNKTFQNLYVTARPPIGMEKRGSGIGPIPEISPTREQGKLSTFGASNKAVARANEYDGPDLTIAQMKANYKKNTGIKKPQRVQTNLLQPEQFKIISADGPMRLDNPIVSVEGRSSNHFYALDYQIVGPVRMNVLTSKSPKTGKVKSPNLRPETVGEIKLGKQIGEIQTSNGKEPVPLYDYVEIEATPSLPPGVKKRDKFQRGGRVLSALKRKQYQQGSKVTRVGRPTHQGDFGSGEETYSERSVTFPIDKGETQWVTFPSVLDTKGTISSESTVREYVLKNGPVDPITGEKFPIHSSVKEAEQYAKERSSGLMREK